MTRQVIDTTTNNGTYIGDPAKVAFEKTNANFGELYDRLGVPFAESLSDKKLALIAGALCQSSTDLTQWYWINDVGHIPVGVSSIIASGDSIYISFDTTFGRVISIIASPDETFAQWGMSIGSSVSLNQFVLRGSVSSQIAGQVRCLGSGVWEHKISTGGTVVDGVAPVISGTNITVTHPYVSGGNFNHPTVTPFSNNSEFFPRIPVLRRSTPTSFVTQFFNSTLDGFLRADTADNTLSLAYRKGYSGPVNFDGTGNSGTIEFYNGNIWVLGVMELA